MCQPGDWINIAWMLTISGSELQNFICDLRKYVGNELQTVQIILAYSCKFNPGRTIT